MMKHEFLAFLVAAGLAISGLAATAQAAAPQGQNAANSSSYHGGGIN